MEEKLPRRPAFSSLKRRWVRWPLLVLLDGGMALIGLWCAMLLRFEGQISAPYDALFPRFAILLVVSRIVANLLLRLHRWSFRFSSLADAARVVAAGLLGTGIFLILLYLLYSPLAALANPGPPRSVLALEAFISITLMGAFRFSPRLTSLYVSNFQQSRRQGSVRTLILGGGATGELLLRDLQRSNEHLYRIVGFLDDDPEKWDTIVGGKPVLGAVKELPEWVKRLRVSKVLLAIPRLGAAEVREILSVCAGLKVRLKILPVSFIYLTERAPSSLLKDLSPEDLLTRDPVTLSRTEEAEAIEGRRILVTGGAGSIGSETCLQLLEAGASELVIADINENAMYFLTRRLETRFPAATITAEVVDIRDAARVQVLMKQYRPQAVVHAAAHKHVPLLEHAPCEAVKNNVLGTKLVGEAAGSVGADRFLFISTDKAVSPSSVMGATKRIGEMVIRDLGRRYATEYCAVRFGNVLGSAGSVVPLFREQIERGGPVTVTHPEIRRYFMTVTEAVGLVLKSSFGGLGELCVLEMGEQMRILDLARHMITMAGLVPDLDIAIEFTGLRPGEKLSEELLVADEEKVDRKDRKIWAIRSPAPGPGFSTRLDELILRASAEDAEGTRRCLCGLVPSLEAAQVAELRSRRYATP